MRANNRFRGRRRAVSPASARRGALAMGMMAQSGRRSAFRNAVTGGNVFDCECCLDPYCQQKESGCKRLGGSCQCPCPASMSATTLQRSSFRGASGCYANQSGGFQGVESLLDALADPIDISGGDFGGVDSLLDDLATPQNDLGFGQGGGVPPTPVFPEPPRNPIVPVISGGGGGMPPYVPSTPTFPVAPASLMPPPASRRRRPNPRPRPMRPRNIGTGFSFM